MPTTVVGVENPFPTREAMLCMPCIASREFYFEKPRRRPGCLRGHVWTTRRRVGGRCARFAGGQIGRLPVSFWDRVEGCTHAWVLTPAGEARCRRCRVFKVDDGVLSGWPTPRWEAHWKRSKPLLEGVLWVPRRD